MLKHDAGDIIFKSVLDYGQSYFYLGNYFAELLGGKCKPRGTRRVIKINKIVLYNK